jgi:hypothetical protein
MDDKALQDLGLGKWYEYEEKYGLSGGIDSYKDTYVQGFVTGYKFAMIDSSLRLLE